MEKFIDLLPLIKIDSLNRITANDMGIAMNDRLGILAKFVHAEFANKYPGIMIFWRSVPVGVELFGLETIRVSPLIPVGQKYLLERCDSKMGNTDGAKGNMVIDNIVLRVNRAAVHECSGYLIDTGYTFFVPPH